MLAEAITPLSASAADDTAPVSSWCQPTADAALRGRGVGRDLVQYAEEVSRGGGCRYMQLELRYRVQRVGHIEEAYPDLAPLLCTAADFRIYRKTL